MRLEYYYLLTLSGVIATSLAHVLMKFSARRGRGAIKTWFDPRSVGAYALLSFAVIATTFSIRELDYGLIVAISALAYPLVALFSVFLLKEPLTRRAGEAQMLVCLGVFLYCMPI
jgi:drug/metabolite transporter (DMT)-like permease